MWKYYLADAIVAIHFLWIAFVLGGQLFILLGMFLGWSWTRNFWFRFIHLSMMLLVAAESLFGLDCPLTVWENRLRVYDPSVPGGHRPGDSFIARWAGIIFVSDQFGGSDWPFLLGYLTFTALVVWSFLKAPPRLPMTPTAFVTLVHVVLGVVLVTTNYQYPGVGIFFLAEGYVWWRLTRREDGVPT